MKHIISIGIALFLGLITGCNPSEKPVSENRKEEQAAVLKPVISSNKLIVPGKSAGKIYLGQDMNQVFKILGNADRGEAAMGKAWSIWNDNIAIYSSYKDSTMTTKDVKQIRVENEGYATENEIKINTAYADIKQKHPTLTLAATFVNEIKDTLFVYDDVKEGIAFDMRKENGKLINKAMTIHPKKESVSNTYLTIYPGWKKME